MDVGAAVSILEEGAAEWRFSGTGAEQVGHLG